MKRLIAVPLLCLALAGAPACALFQTAPQVDSVSSTRKKAIQTANTVTMALGIYTSMLEVVDVQSKAGQIPDTVTRALATGGKKFADVAGKALDSLERVTTNPSLKATIQEVITALAPLIQTLEASQKDALRAFGFSLRIALELLQQAAGGL